MIIWSRFFEIRQRFIMKNSQTKLFNDSLTQRESLPPVLSNFYHWTDILFSDLDIWSFLKFHSPSNSWPKETSCVDNLSERDWILLKILILQTLKILLWFDFSCHCIYYFYNSSLCCDLTQIFLPLLIWPFSSLCPRNYRQKPLEVCHCPCGLSLSAIHF